MSTILIVDDEPIIRQLAGRILEHDGHTLLTASNGREALEVLREKTPDLVLLDLQMPQMDGLTFLKLMRGNRDWAGIPVVIMSALANKTNIALAGTLGVRDYLLKAGFSLKQMRARLNKYLVTEDHAAAAGEQTVNVSVDAMLVE